MKLHEDLFELARVVDREERVDSDIFGLALFQISLDSIVSLVLLPSELSTQLDDQVGKLSVLKQL